MVKNHTILNGTHCAYWDVDSLNLVGIAAADIDNGTFLTLGAMSPNSDGAYEFTVTAGANPDLVAGTPPQGYNVDAQVYDDPRYFTNEAGKPISVKRLIKGDCIEVSAGAFTAEPASSATFATVQDTGKMTANTIETGAHFKVLSARTMDIGGEAIKTWVLMKLA